MSRTNESSLRSITIFYITGATIAVAILLAFAFKLYAVDLNRDSRAGILSDLYSSQPTGQLPFVGYQGVSEATQTSCFADFSKDRQMGVDEIMYILERWGENCEYQIPEENHNELIAKAETEGIVRIIVGLNIPFQPEGELPDSQSVQMQRQRITEAQDSLLDNLMIYNVTLVKKFEYIPYMTIVVDVAALEYVISSPEVFSVEEDVPVPFN